MRSFRRQADNRRSIYLHLIGSIESQLRDAYAKRHKDAGETQSSLAERLEVDRSVVHRRLMGQTNMTIHSVADLVWALGHCIDVRIFDPNESRTNAAIIVPDTNNLVISENSSTVTQATMTYATPLEGADA